MANQVQFSTSTASTSQRSSQKSNYDASQSAFPIFPIVDQSAMSMNVDLHSPVVKTPKRKRLIKACDACHKSKRRCDGHAPCDNCYHAPKECRYTDAAGRVIPAPNGIRNASNQSQNNASSDTHTNNSAALDKDLESQYTAPNLNPPEAGPSSITYIDTSGNMVSQQPRKRTRQDDQGIHNPTRPSDVKSSSISEEDKNELGSSSNLVTRELVNLFFAHCHPHCLVIHKPTFTNELSLNRVPAYLLYAVYALSAPLSRNSAFHTRPIRYSGIRYAHQARQLIFDGKTDVLKVRACLPLAQALCFLQIHEFTVMQHSSLTDAPYFAVALRMLNDLDVYQEDNPVMVPFPTVEQKRSAIDRECLRRTFWLIYLIRSLSPIFVKGGIYLQKQEPSIRLPCDETNFELSTYAALPEYLHSQAPMTDYASEFGHIIRVAHIFKEIEDMSVSNGISNVCEPVALARCERALQNWVENLPNQLRFSENNLQLHMSMWETSSNTSAWCFCLMHNLHACCIIVLSELQTLLRLIPIVGREQAQEKLCTIITTLGPRVNNSAMMGVVLWLWHFRLPIGSPNYQSAYRQWTHNCLRVQRQIEEWLENYRILWGLKEDEIVPHFDALCNNDEMSMSVSATLAAAPLSLSEESSSSSRLIQSISKLDIYGDNGYSIQSSKSGSNISKGGSKWDSSWRNTKQTQPSLPSLKAIGLLGSPKQQHNSTSTSSKITDHERPSITPFNSTPYLRVNPSRNRDRSTSIASVTSNPTSIILDLASPRVQVTHHSSLLVPLSKPSTKPIYPGPAYPYT